jgi:hypothetical protein
MPRPLGHALDLDRQRHLQNIGAIDLCTPCRLSLPGLD